MTWPLIFLAILSAIGGFIGIPHYLFPDESPEQLNMKVAIISSILAIAGLVAAYCLYGKRLSTDPLVAKLGSIYPALKNKFYFDEVYAWYVNHVQQTFAIYLENFEKLVIVGLFVDGIKDLARIAGRGLRKLQTGLVQTYALGFILGAIILFVTMTGLL